MDVKLSVEQNDAINSIAKDEGFEDFFTTTRPGSSKGENYMGTITNVSVKKGDKKLDLLMKSSLKSVKLRKAIPIRKAYLREIHLYQTVFSAFENFLKEEGCLDPFTGHPKIYGSCTKDLEEFVILEDLKEAGYDLWNRKVPMNWDHISLVLKEYGKFHATSLAMKEKNPELYEKLTKGLTNFRSTTNEEADENTKKKKIEDEERNLKTLICGAIEAVKGNRAALDCLERFSSTVGKFFNEDINAPEDQLVLLHGDCWCNNFLFKYEDPQIKHPSKVSLIDWQISSIGSPARDLAYFLFTNAPKEILSDYKESLITYHDAASETLRSVGCDPETVYPFELLELQWRKYTKFGLRMAIKLLKVMVSESHEVPDVTEVFESGKNLTDELLYKSVNNDEYKRRLLDVVTVCVENDWF
ncbi:hypothetical protein NQ318_013331 [Aromia moschata]|uniref:CHK kinase-like domain-containing protein n=1 Tax=Aromia moschata TaxID=1265417 RepID=A0AAV8XV91_9CUCU|nr:hypothetical protein NQ318_013331 [Aromia moschata]